jgi:hypothetical protein
LLIEAAENHPFTVIVVGVGAEKFKELEYLNDVESFAHTVTQKKCLRPCSLFVRARDFDRREKELTSKILAEV